MNTRFLVALASAGALLAGCGGGGGTPGTPNTVGNVKGNVLQFAVGAARRSIHRRSRFPVRSRLREARRIPTILPRWS